MEAAVAESRGQEYASDVWSGRQQVFRAQETRTESRAELKAE